MCIALVCYKIPSHTILQFFNDNDLTTTSGTHQSYEAQRHPWFDLYYTANCFRVKFSMLTKCTHSTKTDLLHQCLLN